MAELYKVVTTNPGIQSEFKEFGITPMMIGFIRDAFNPHIVKEGMKSYRDSFFIFKYKN